jgi:hypothetical protein
MLKNRKACRNTCVEDERMFKRRTSIGIFVLRMKEAEKYRNTCVEDERILKRQKHSQQKNVGILDLRMKEYLRGRKIEEYLCWG